ncbi:hypothetical protein [Williamsia sp. Leaf354]|uniref:hypothetical protein n=1 Tax=Williamsia sp. Leaf354 TaxID=1736349 RepID=UPI001F35E085|nr:hypothetical protein [Williamsia sp. Leaf354]
MAALANSAFPTSAPRWLRVVILGDKNLSAFYVGAAFTFAPLLIAFDPWRPLVIVAWTLIATAGLWLGILGILMAAGLALVLRAGDEMPDSYWDSVLTRPGATRGIGGAITSRDPVRRR